MIVTCQHANGLAIVLLIAVESSKLVWSVFLARKGTLRNKVLVAAEVNQPVFLIVYLLILMFLHRLGPHDVVSDGLQTLGKYCIIAAIICEYIILVSLVVHGVTAFIRQRNLEKR